jgi:hypothetical protein
MRLWLRVGRGMIGTGLTFAAGVGLVVSIVGGLVWLGQGVTTIELMRAVGKFSVVSFLLGVAFSGILAVAARGRRFRKLSLPLVGATGAGAGLAYWIFLALNGGRSWSTPIAILNFIVLILMGAGSATAMLLIARRAGSALDSGDELPMLRAAEEEIMPERRDSTVEVPRL